MVRWYHAIFSAYGYWLPNDPRGSWSTWVGSWELFHFGGRATKVDDKRSYAYDPHDADLRREAKQHLKYPPVRFDGRQREAVAQGIARACEESGIVVHACAIGYDHVHAVVARHAKSIEKVVGQFRGRATQRLKADDIHPLARHASVNRDPPSPWAEGMWSVFINDEQQLRAAIGYVERHPMKEGLPRQRWSFVRPYVDPRIV